MIRSVFSFLFCLTVFQVSAQLKIEVKSADGSPVPHAAVKILESGELVLCDVNGSVEIEFKSPGKYEIELQATGYRTQREELDWPSSVALRPITMKEDVLGLEDLVVSASRYEEKRSQSAVLVHKIPQQLLERTHVVALSEGLNYQSGLRLETNCQNCGFTQVRMNGLEGQYTQILIDGKPVQSALAGVYGLEQLPAAMIEKVEVVRGGGSALYGANAIAGTVNIITKDPVKNTFNAAVNTAWVDFSTLDATTSLNGALVNEALNAGLSFFGMNRQRDWYDANGDGFSELTQLENTSFGMRTYYKPKERTKIQLEAHFIEEYRRGGDRFDFQPHESSVAEMLDHGIWSAQLAVEHYSKDLKQHVSVYSSVQRTLRDSYYGGGGNSTSVEDQLAAMKMYGRTQDFVNVSGLQYVYTLPQVLGRKAKLSAGAEHRLNTVHDQMRGYNRDIEQTVRTTGVYAHLELRPLKNLKFSPGLRGDWANIAGTYKFGAGPDLKTDKNLQRLSPRVSALYDLSRNNKLRATFSSGFRTPQAFDEDFHLTLLGGDVEFVRFSEALETEKSASWSLSIDHAFSIQETWDAYVLVEGFYTTISDAFLHVFTGEKEPESGAWIVDKVNANGTARVMGINAEIQLVKGRYINLKGGGTFQESRYSEVQTVFTSEEGEDFNVTSFLRAPNAYGYATLGIDPSPAWSFTISEVMTGPMQLIYRGGSTGPLGDGTPHVLKTQFFHDITGVAAYTVDLPGKTKLTLSVGLKNILNHYQADWDVGAERDATYIYGPGTPRTLLTKLKLALP